MKENHCKLLAVFLAASFLLPLISGIAPRTASTIALESEPELAEDLIWTTYEKNMNVTTFVSPDGSKDELWHFLNSAEESIYVEIYGINNPRILDLIHNLHDTKPTLDMKFLIGWNSLGYYSPNDYVANNLTLLGYPVKWTSDTDFVYAHQKFVIIDNKTTIVHSGNWAKTSFPEPDGKANREWSIAMTDPDVTGYYRNVFDMDWGNGTDYDAETHGTGTALTYTYTTSTYQEPFAEAGEFSGDMKVTPIFSPDTSLQGILYCINAANYTLDIQIPYFTNVGDAGSVDQIIDAILAARARGVTVRVISEEAYDWALVEDIFIEHGIPIVWQDTRWFSANHNKGIIVDGKIVLISSINYSDNSIENNREAGVIIENWNVAQWYLEVYDFDWGMADFDAMENINLYWEPNIPSSIDVINVTVFGHMYYSVGFDEVKLGVKIGPGPWTNHTITSNIYDSVEDDLENFYYEIPAQSDGTNITVQAFIQSSSVWYKSINMTIHVLDLPPRISNPKDLYFEEGTFGHTIEWSPLSAIPHKYEIYRNEGVVDSGIWDGSAIPYPVYTLSAGTYNCTLSVNDTNGDFATDTVMVYVSPEANPTISDESDFAFEKGTSENIVSWTVSDLSPHKYVIYQNESKRDSGLWKEDVTEFAENVDDLELGLWNITLFVNDTIGNSNYDTVLINCEDTTAPTFTSTPSNSMIEYGDNTEILNWTGFDLYPAGYTIIKNSADFTDGIWNATTEMISIEFSDLEIGINNITLVLADTSSNEAVNFVLITVTDTFSPSFSTVPDDVEFEIGTSGESISWIGSDLDPSSYTILQNGSVLRTGSWNSTSETITLSLDGLESGVYNYTLILTDGSGNQVSDTAIVTVVASSTTTTTTTTTTTETSTGTDTTPTNGEPMDFITIMLVVIVAAIVVLGGLCTQKKR